MKSLKRVKCVAALLCATFGMVIFAGNPAFAITPNASIINIAARLKQRCGFASYGSGFPFIKPAQNQADCILDILSLIQMEEGHLEYDPEQKLKQELSSGTLLFIIGPEQVDLYNDKIAARQYGITTKTLGIMKEVHK